jgi:hypothetical protein
MRSPRSGLSLLRRYRDSRSGLFVKRIVATVLSIFALFPCVAQAYDAAIEALEGAWVVQVGGQTRDRFLIVSGATRDRNHISPGTAVYGWIDSRGAAARDLNAEVFGDQIRLRFTTPADSLVEVQFRVDETSVSGEMTTKAGKKHDVRMTRITAEELQALRAAAGEAKGVKDQSRSMKLARDARIYLVYVGADDCPPCRRFEAKYRHVEKLKEIEPALLEAQFVKVSLWSYRDAVLPSALPDGLRWLLEADSSGRPRLRKRGTPFFAAVVDRMILAQGHGTTALEKLVAPAIRRAIEARRAAQ